MAATISETGAPCGPTRAPLLEGTPLPVASSSRPPADASGGQENGPLSPCKPPIGAEGEGRNRVLSAGPLGRFDLVTLADDDQSGVGDREAFAIGLFIDTDLDSIRNHNVLVDDRSADHGTATDVDALEQ